MSESFDLEELADPETLAGKCSGGTCCLVSGSLDEPFVMEELADPETLAGKCSGGTCCLAYGNLTDD